MRWRIYLEKENHQRIAQKMTSEGAEVLAEYYPRSKCLRLKI